MVPRGRTHEDRQSSIHIIVFFWVEARVSWTRPPGVVAWGMGLYVRVSMLISEASRKPPRGIAVTQSMRRACIIGVLRPSALPNRTPSHFSGRRCSSWSVPLHCVHSLGVLCFYIFIIVFR